MKTNCLVDLVTKLRSLDQRFTIYAVEPWTCDSEAIVAQEPDSGGQPAEADAIGAVYFIEVFIAIEFLEAWMAAEKRPIADRGRCERLVRYALQDA